MDVRRIEYGSDEYAEECAVRERILRRPLGLSLWDEDLTVEAAQWHFGLFDDERLIGCVVAIPVSDQRIKLRQMAIVEERQNAGCGRLLLTQVEIELRAAGFSEIYLHAREEAAPFYQKLGYSPVGPGFIEVTLPHLAMEKRL